MADEPANPNGSAALRLLRGVAEELRGLADETARFGDTLSSDFASTRAPRAVELLQRFDLYSQNLQAHAHVIDNLAMRIETDSDNVSALHELIGSIPFFGMRERLHAKLSGSTAEQSIIGEDIGDDHWF